MFFILTNIHDARIGLWDQNASGCDMLLKPRPELLYFTRQQRKSLLSPGLNRSSLSIPCDRKNKVCPHPNSSMLYYE
ncbi:hypothetical protein HanRHA438_Chr13g0579301 [Helianthus annuus]|nr:hypothetical protein HanIR_Chr13g0618501 [Helianthus annuus]KAJ0856515.1 hypothetical protein HanRHA438_Chr13g0579301 [Helianthus annuus]